MEQKEVLSEREQERYLNSWKEIAHYLGVHVRTAQKWEAERQLPVQRGSGKRSRVSVQTTSLKNWKQQLHSAVDTNRYYRWPLGSTTTVEIHFFGSEIGPGHIELLQDYLNLFRSALACGDSMQIKRQID